jgi:hypothetical protein
VKILQATRNFGYAASNLAGSDTYSRRPKHVRWGVEETGDGLGGVQATNTNSRHLAGVTPTSSRVKQEGNSFLASPRRVQVPSRGSIEVVTKLAEAAAAEARDKSCSGTNRFQILHF